MEGNWMSATEQQAGATGQLGLFVRKSTGLVREASALDATIFNAVLSAPVGVALAWYVFFALAAFPGSDLVGSIVLAVLINIPVLILFALLAASMPRVGGDYVWVSRILHPSLGLISNLAIAVAGIFGTVFFAKFFAVFALGPVLSSMGTLFDSSALIDAGTAFQTDKLWILLAGLAMIALVTFVLIRGVRSTFRWQNVFFVIASAGTFLAFVVLLIGTAQGFATNFDAVNTKYGGGTIQDVIAAVGAGGAAPNLGNLDATLPTLFIVMGMMMWNWWSIYMAGELKSAANRSRQLLVMFGALLWDGIWLVIGTLLLFNITGYNFIVAVNQANDAYAIPSGAWYHYMVALVFNNPIMTILIMGSFLFWSLPGMIANIYMPIRSVFAWSFDRLLPERLSEVNERTHSPVPAILLCSGIVALVLIWNTFSSDFQTLLGLVVLAGSLAVIIVAIAAILLPTRRPELYRASPANLKLFGIPVLYITGVASLIIFAGMIYLTIKYPALVMAGNPDNWWWIPAFLGGIAVGGLAIYYVAKFVRARQGIDIDLVYRELPPE
jgi:amino acid transporter